MTLRTHRQVMQSTHRREHLCTLWQVFLRTQRQVRLHTHMYQLAPLRIRRHVLMHTCRHVPTRTHNGRCSCTHNGRCSCTHNGIPCRHTRHCKAMQRLYRYAPLSVQRDMLQWIRRHVLQHPHGKSCYTWKGLHFWCNEKYVKQHNGTCPRPKARCIAGHGVWFSQCNKKGSFVFNRLKIG